MRKINMNISNFNATNSFIKNIFIDNEEVINVIKDQKIIAFDEPTFAKLIDCEFENGIIEVKMYSQLLADAPEFARGFIGLAFRINEDNTKFESIYIRPTNSRVNDQLRRNRTTQYFSYPNHKFDDFRRTDPGKYESYVNIDVKEWIDFKLVVEDISAQLYINNSIQPVLVVNDLKHGKSHGAIALWTDIGTDAYFKDLIITYK